MGPASEVARNAAPADAGRGRLRLNLCSGPDAVEGWVNVDYFVGARIARLPVVGWLARGLGLTRASWPRCLVMHDIRKPLPWGDGTVEAVYSSHTLEHLTRGEGLRFFEECRRVLAPGGIIRVVVPDFRVLVRKYRDGEIASVDFVDALGVMPYEPGDAAWKRLLAPWVRFPHKCMYDSEGLLEQMRAAGFEPELRPPFVSALSDVDTIETPERTVDAVIAEAIRE